MKIRLLVLAILTLVCGYTRAQTIRYVKSSGNGGTANGNGLSWATASNDLQAMINASSSGDQVWVASSVNLPARRADNITGPKIGHRANAFVLKEGVEIYGGFPPAGGNWDSRAPSTHTTYLSGEIATNGQEDDDDSNNTWHVVIAVGQLGGAVLSSATVLDGFTIYGGRAFGESTMLVNGHMLNNRHGAGILNLHSNATFANLVIMRNKAFFKGGGVYNYNTSSRFSNSAIINNATTYEVRGSGGSGGGMNNENNASPILKNVLISGNRSSVGAGMFNLGSHPVMTNVTIRANTSILLGGGVFNGDESSPVLTNVTISGNYAQALGNEWYNHSGIPVIRNSIIRGLGLEAKVPFHDVKYSLVEDQDGNENYAAEANHNLSTYANPKMTALPNGGFTLGNDSPAINAGNNQYYWDAVNEGTPLSLPGDTDLSGNPRIFYGRIDIGAHESQEIPRIALGSGNILYVDRNVNGSDGSGSSWNNAMSELADALQYARAVNDFTEENPLKIYVAKGVFKPLYGAGDNNYFENADRFNSFVMVRNVQLFGGFDPENGVVELSHTRISPAADEDGTVLSGDLGAPDLPDDNAYSVVISSGDVGNARLDGFTVSGGNADLSSGSITVNGKVFQRNFGGGVCHWDSSPALVNLHITGNAAGYLGAGIYNYNSSPQLTNVAITRNTSSVFGGGGFNVNSSPVLTNVTISGNTANNSGAEWQNASGTPVIRNSIIWGNGVQGQLTDTQNSLVQSQSRAGNASYFSASNHNIAPDTDPQFANAPGGDYSLSNSSAAINAGRNIFFEGLQVTTLDLKGNPRVHRYNEDGIIDLGAYENQIIRIITPDASNILYVDQHITGGDGSGSSWANAITQVGDALRYARSGNNYSLENPLKIYVAKGTYQPLYDADDAAFHLGGNRHNSFVMVKNVQIYGGFDPAAGITELAHHRLTPHITSFEQQTILSGEIGNPDSDTDNVYNVVISAGDVGNAVLDGFAIVGGHAELEENILVNGRELTRNTGGGIFNIHSSPLLIRLNITRNSAFVGGGGIYNKESSPVISLATISENTAESGAGVYNLNGSPVMKNVAILDNDGVFGGGVYNSTSTPVVSNVTISGNTASYEGNEWYNGGGIPVIRNSVIWGNGVAGQLYDTQYSLVQDQTVEGNANYYMAAHDNLSPDTNPLFASPNTGDYTLLHCSEAINAGMPDISGLNLPMVDLAGQERVFADRVDMGAFESNELPSSGSGVAQVASELERVQTPNGTTDFIDGCNGWLVSVTTTGLPTDLVGNTIARVWIDQTQPGQYVRRHYEITPSDNASGATGRVTLYFTQDDFDAFNELNPAAFLPSGPSDDTGNLRIEKIGGVSSDGTGNPKSYSGLSETIADVDVVWNEDQMRWEVSFGVTGFSGFFVKTTDSPLPVRWISFSATLNDQQQTVLDWLVDETDVSHYEVQRSVNGRSFTSVATIKSLGQGVLYYTLTDPVVVAGSSYYRIRQTDLDGSYIYSRLMSIKAPESIRLRLYPNPTADRITVEAGEEYYGTKLRLINLSGELLQEVHIYDSATKLSLQQYAPGIYVLYTYDGRGVRVVKE